MTLRQMSAILAVLLATTTACSAQIPAWSVEDGQNRAPYIFVQQHNGKTPQRVRLGWPLQVQLPGNPTVWTFQKDQSANVEPRGRSLVFSPGRIEGTQSVFIFDFVLAPNARAGDTGIITITSRNAPMSLLQIIPDGQYQIRFEITNP